jgi:uncharacterized protein Yka (UPF0111/DUF47 family)
MVLAAPVSPGMMGCVEPAAVEATAGRRLWHAQAMSPTLIPHSPPFFDWFDQAAANNLDGARMLLDLLERFEDVPAKLARIEDMEHRGDDLTHLVRDALQTSFLAPLDHDDLTQLALALDDVADLVEGAAKRLQRSKLSGTTPLSRDLGKVVVDQCEQLKQAVTCLTHGRDWEGMEAPLEEVRRLENVADDLLDEAIATLYDGVTTVPGVIQGRRWGAIYQVLEEATDKARNVATVLHNIAIKNA